MSWKLLTLSFASTILSKAFSLDLAQLLELIFKCLFFPAVGGLLLMKQNSSMTQTFEPDRMTLLKTG